MSNLTQKELRMFELGKKQGREEMLAEILSALKIEEKIAEAIQRHEVQTHGEED